MLELIADLELIANLELITDLGEKSVLSRCAFILKITPIAQSILELVGLVRMKSIELSPNVTIYQVSSVFNQKCPSYGIFKFPL